LQKNADTLAKIKEALNFRPGAAPDEDEEDEYGEDDDDDDVSDDSDDSDAY